MYILNISFSNVYSPKGSSIENLYFWLSLVFLLSRTLLVTLIAAKLNDESKRPIRVLRAIPTEHYQTEVSSTI